MRTRGEKEIASHQGVVLFSSLLSDGLSIDSIRSPMSDLILSLCGDYLWVLGDSLSSVWALSHSKVDPQTVAVWVLVG